MTRATGTAHQDAAPMTLLLVASSPSDLTEVEGTARALAKRGHQIQLAYFYSGGVRHIHVASLEKLRTIRLSEPNVRTVSVNVDRRLAEIQAHLKVKSSHRAARLTVAQQQEPQRPRMDRLRGWLQQRGMLERVDRTYLVLRDPYRALLGYVRAARRLLSRGMMQHMSTVYAFIATLQLLRIYRSYSRLFDTLLDQRDYQAIVVPEDVVGPFWPTLIKAGLRHRLPTIILPYTLANREEAFKSLRGQVDFQTRLNRLAAFFYPHWRMRDEGFDIVRMPAGHIFVHQFLGIAPPDPWMMNSGRARMICVDSQASFDYFLRAGIPPARMTITGSVSQDQLASTLHHKAEGLRQLREELGLEGDKPLLLVSGCPNQLAGSVPYCEFPDMKAVADHLGAALQPLAPHYHLVVRPHPNYPEFAEFMRAHGVVPTLTPTARLVPLSDLFIAFASATIRWAAACGTPTVNYDIFHYGYSDFAANKGVVTVSGSQEFLALVQRLRPDSSDYEAMWERSQSDAAYWSVMDERGLERIEAVLRQFSRAART